MSWGKVDDQLHKHPKFARVSLEAIGLWTLCLSWTNDALTDGQIPAGLTQRIAATRAKKLTAELVDAGLWERLKNGDYLIHDFHVYNPHSVKAAENQRKLHEVRSDAGRRGAEKRWQNHSKSDGKPMANAMANGMAKPDFAMAKKWQTDSPRSQVPVPVPGSEDSTETLMHSTDRQPTTGGVGGAADAAQQTRSADGRMVGGGGGGGELPNGLEDAEGMDPGELLSRYRAAFPERESELQAVLADAKTEVKHQAKYLRPHILRRLRGQEPPRLTPSNAKRAKQRTESEEERESASAYRVYLGPEESPDSVSAALAERFSANGSSSHAAAGAVPPAPAVETAAERKERLEREQAAITDELARLEQDDPDSFAQMRQEVLGALPEPLRDRPNTPTWERTVASQMRLRVKQRLAESCLSEPDSAQKNGGEAMLR